MKLYYTSFKLPTGIAHAAASDKGVVRLSIGGMPLRDFLRELEVGFGVRPVKDAGPFGTLVRELDGYFAGEVKDFSARLDLNGTEFQMRVWSKLLKVKYGTVRTYGWLANAVGNPDAARAVGGALNRNPVPIIVPCHRIVGASGSLGGYACGLDIKRRLLELEGVCKSGTRVYCR